MLKAIGAPFKLEYSSCGSSTPHDFRWSSSQGIAEVFIDNVMPMGLEDRFSKTRFGWLCESKIVRRNIHLHVVENLRSYKRSYAKIFTCDQGLIDLDPDLFEFCFAGSNLPWTPPAQRHIYKKNKTLSLLASPKQTNPGHVARIQLAEQFRYKADLYGGIFGSRKIGIGDSEHYHHQSKADALNDYMFSVAIENCKYNTYFTEKITDCFATGTIPIYYGTENVKEYFDGDGIIFIDSNFDTAQLTPELYYSKINAIERNFQVVNTMLSADDYLYRKIINLI
jgi:hypothetical protein